MTQTGSQKELRPLSFSLFFSLFHLAPAAEIAGLKLLLVHARDEAAADLCRKHGFEPVVDDPLKLFLPVAPLAATC